MTTETQYLITGDVLTSLMESTLTLAERAIRAEDLVLLKILAEDLVKCQESMAEQFPFSRELDDVLEQLKKLN